jgi:formamidopyrimidine-DNA glycosylase
MLSGGTHLWFWDTRRFGEWYLVKKPGEVSGIKGMGPEPLEITRKEFVQRLRGRRGQIKALLLDQAFLGGLGNIYVCEALYRAGINPRHKSSSISLSNIMVLYHHIQVILKEAIRAGGTSVRSFRRSDGRKGWFAQRLKVYGREGSKCSRCCGTIKRIEVSGRGTYYCPGCQK